MDFQQKYSAIQIRCLLLVYFCLNPVVAAPFRDSRDVPEYVSHTHANGNRMHESGNRTTQLENESLGHPATERLYRQRTLRGRNRRQHETEKSVVSTLAQTTTQVNTSTDVALAGDSPEVVAAIDVDDDVHDRQCHAGSLALASLLALWLFAGIYVVCDHYFIPSLEEFGDALGISEDAQGATLLAVGSSSPELFTAVIGVLFYAGENPGPATNIGSALFNQCVILGVSALVLPGTSGGLLDRGAFWRDIGFYLIAIVFLYCFYTVISPGVIEWREAAFLTGVWIIYVTVVLWADAQDVHAPPSSSAVSDEHDARPVAPPPPTTLSRAVDVLVAPFSTVFAWTIPNPRASGNTDDISKGKLGLIFMLSVSWLGLLTYVVVNVVEHVALCLGTPTDVVGVTKLAVGTSAPDCFGSIIAARKGRIKMAVSNALGSNIFDCCLCVGLPFLIDALSHTGAVVVDPTGMGMLLSYLLLVLAIHTGMLWGCGYKLHRWHGKVFLVLYCGFIAFYLVVRSA